MRVVKTASDNKVEISKSEWGKIGNTTGWMKEARFGKYIESPVTGHVWADWKTRNFIEGGNEPTEAEAAEFVKWVEMLIDVGHDQFFPMTKAYMPYLKMLNNIRVSDDSIVGKALKYQGVMRQIEQVSWE